MYNRRDHQGLSLEHFYVNTLKEMRDIPQRRLRYRTMRWKENKASTFLKKPIKNMFQKEEMAILMNFPERSMGFDMRIYH